MKNIKLPTKKGKFTVKEWAEKINLPPASVYFHLNSKKIKTAEVFKRPPSHKRVEYCLPEHSEVKKYSRREWAKLKGIKVYNYLSWLDYRPELKKLFKERPKVVYELPKGQQIKTVTASRWARSKGYNQSSLVAWMKVRDLAREDYFVDGLTARTKFILPKGKDLRRFSVSEWSRQQNLFHNTIYGSLRKKGLKLGDFFKMIRKRKRK